MSETNGEIKKKKHLEFWRDLDQMPELPEVETIKRQLDRRLHNSPTDWDLSIDWYAVFVTKQRTPLVRIMRKGKNLCFHGKEFRVLNHFRMSGRFHVVRSMESSAEEIAGAYQHVKAIFSFHNRGDDDLSFRIVYTDTRGFGICKVQASQNPMEDFEEVRRLGIDPSYPNEFTYNKFVLKLLSTHHSHIGSVLMRQDVIAGIGNIYRSEVLHAAGIHPCREPGSLTKDELMALYDSIREILEKSIKLGGCSINDYRSSYRDLDGNKGQMGRHLAVYQRDGSNCLNCGVGVIAAFDIEKLRRVYYCVDCQR